MNQAKKKVLIVEDHPVMRRGLVALIESEPDLVVCAEIATSGGGLEAIRAHQPDLAIVDLELEKSHGLDLVKGMQTGHREVPALILSMHDEAVYAERCLRAGARGYVTKQQLDKTVLIAIRTVLAGGTYMSEELEARLATKFVDGKTLQSDSPLEVLSNRELQVFRLIGQGLSTRDIAKSLNLSPKTIESHREHIRHKLNIESGAQLAQRATQWVETGRLE